MTQSLRAADRRTELDLKKSRSGQPRTTPNHTEEDGGKTDPQMDADQEDSNGRGRGNYLATDSHRFTQIIR
jgi:hypothetical protein